MVCEESPSTYMGGVKAGMEKGEGGPWQVQQLLPSLGEEFCRVTEHSRLYAFYAVGQPRSQSDPS